MKSVKAFASHPATRDEVLGISSQHVHVPHRWRKHYHRLLKLRERLLQEKADLREQATTNLPVEQLHMADAATDEFDHDLAWSFLSAEQDSLYEVEEALHRIRDGTYGTCEATGKPIPRRRLGVIPWTRFSVEVEAKLETEHAVALPHIEPAHSVTGEDQIRSAERPGQVEVERRKRVPTRAEIAKQLDEQAREEEKEQST